VQVRSLMAQLMDGLQYLHSQVGCTSALFVVGSARRLTTVSSWGLRVLTHLRHVRESTALCP
jgi:hypothetical protein